LSHIELKNPKSTEDIEANDEEFEVEKIQEPQLSRQIQELRDRTSNDDLSLVTSAPG
jgi:hypothetical protein